MPRRKLVGYRERKRAEEEARQQDEDNIQTSSSHSQQDDAPCKRRRTVSGRDERGRSTTFPNQARPPSTWPQVFLAWTRASAGCRSKCSQRWAERSLGLDTRCSFREDLLDSRCALGQRRHGPVRTIVVSREISRANLSRPLSGSLSLVSLSLVSISLVSLFFSLSFPLRRFNRQVETIYW